MLTVNWNALKNADFDPMFGAALVDENGNERPITQEMVNESLDHFVVQQEALEH